MREMDARKAALRTQAQTIGGLRGIRLLNAIMAHDFFFRWHTSEPKAWEDAMKKARDIRDLTARFDQKTAYRIWALVAPVRLRGEYGLRQWMRENGGIPSNWPAE
jgi:hypothetical protein